MFNILSHKGNTNQGYTEIPSHSSQNGNNQENKATNVKKGMEEMEHSHTADRL
jgi:hypothetical protein